MHSKGGGKGPRPERRTTLGYDYTNVSIDEVGILAHSHEEQVRFRRNCDEQGVSVYGEYVWEGPVPRNSFVPINPTMRMSTPEYFAYRKSNQLSAAEASCVVAELLSNVRTSLTSHGMEDGTYDDLGEYSGPRMDAREYRRYLDDVADTPEGARAIAILDMVMESDSVAALEDEVRLTHKKN